MQHRRFGKTEERVSVFTFGAMRYMDSDENAVATTKAAVAAGINHLETARGYGESERMLGLALQELDRRSLVVETKIGPTDTADEFRRCLDESLQRLQTDYVDNLAVHGINTPELLEKTLKPDGALTAIRRAMGEGIVRHAGFSTHAPLEVILAALNTGEFEFVNLHYYYFNQRNAEAVRRARQLDMGVFIISPTDKGGQLFNPPDKLRRMTAPWTPLQFNHRWLLADPDIHTLSLGAAKPEELAEHLAVADRTGPLTAAEMAIVAALDAEFPRVLGRTWCEQCWQCLPCPEDVQIPEVLRLRNMALALDMTGFGRYRYAMFGNGGHWFPGQNGSKCTDCGDCLPRCPVKLDIPALLREADRLLATDEQGKRLWGDD
jgi:predicted aldo/keto reductase-like oxidoreductase